MSSLYDRAEIYDLLESEKRNEAARRDWQAFWAAEASGRCSTSASEPAA